MIIDKEKRIAVENAPIEEANLQSPQVWTVYPTLEAYEKEKELERLLKQTYKDMWNEEVYRCCEKRGKGMTKGKAYLTLHKESGLKVGDIVRVLKAAESGEMGWHNSWNPNMTSSIGKMYKIVSDFGRIGFELENYFSYPFYVLEKIEAQREEKMTKQEHEMILAIKISSLKALINALKEEIAGRNDFIQSARKELSELKAEIKRKDQKIQKLNNAINAVISACDNPERTSDLFRKALNEVKE